VKEGCWVFLFVRNKDSDLSISSEHRQPHPRIWIEFNSVCSKSKVPSVVFHLTMKSNLLFVLFLAFGLTTAAKLMQRPMGLKKSGEPEVPSGISAKDQSSSSTVSLDDDDYSAYEDGSGDDSLEKIADAEVSEVEDDESFGDDSVKSSINKTSSKKDDIAFEDNDDDDDDDEDDDEDDFDENEEDNDVNEEPEEKSENRPATSEAGEKTKDDLLYEYNYGLDDDDDYEDLGESDDSKPPVPSVTLPKENTAGADVDTDDEDDDDDDDSVVIEVNDGEDSNKQISRTFFVTLIAGSAVITFITLMLAFYVYRTFRNKNKQKLKPFIVSPAAYGPPPISTSVRSAPIVKNYQRVPTSTKEFLFQQQQLQMQQDSETKAPLLT